MILDIILPCVKNCLKIVVSREQEKSPPDIGQKPPGQKPPDIVCRVMLSSFLYRYNVNMFLLRWSILYENTYFLLSNLTMPLSLQKIHENDNDVTLFFFLKRLKTQKIYNILICKYKLPTDLYRNMYYKGDNSGL